MNFVLQFCAFVFVFVRGRLLRFVACFAMSISPEQIDGCCSLPTCSLLCLPMMGMLLPCYGCMLFSSSLGQAGTGITTLFPLAFLPLPFCMHMSQAASALGRSACSSNLSLICCACVEWMACMLLYEVSLLLLHAFCTLLTAAAC